MASWIDNDPKDESWANKLITLLKIVSRIEPGDKIYTEGDLFHVEPNGVVIQAVRRTLCGEGRIKNIQRLKCVAENMTNYIECEYSSAPQGSPKEQLMLRCIASLRGSVVGLRNLSISYGHDACTMAQIDCIIERIESFLEQYT